MDMSVRWRSLLQRVAGFEAVSARVDVSGSNRVRFACLTIELSPNLARP
jgi:hypothetical protein